MKSGPVDEDITMTEADESPARSDSKASSSEPAQINVQVLQGTSGSGSSGSQQADLGVAQVLKKKKKAAYRAARLKMETERQEQFDAIFGAL